MSIALTQSTKRKFIQSALLSLAVLGLSACSTSVERVGTDKTLDLSGKWNDTDSRLVAEEMMADVLARPWIADFMRERGRRPTVIVGAIRNLSHEHVNTNTFIADMERALVNSGRVDFVADSGERDEVREERKDQDLNASEDTRNAAGQEMGADFMLKGQINSIVDQEGRRSVRFYQVDLTLISLKNSRKVWLGQKKLKKDVKKPRFRL